MTADPALTTPPPVGVARPRMPALTVLRHPLDWLAGLVDRRGDVQAVALMRVLFGAIVIRHFWPELTADVTPVEHFHVPWWSWLPTPSAGLYRGLVIAGCCGGAAMLLRPIARAGTMIAFAVTLYLLFVDMTTFSHNRGFLVWLLFGLALIPARRPTGGRLLWPLFLMRVVASSVYLASGGSKLLDPDWRSGLVLFDRVRRTEYLVPFDGWMFELVTSRLGHRIFSPAAIATELFIGLGFWFRRTRLAAIWTALLFHGLIEVTSNVQTFSYSGIAATLLWATPSTRGRTVSVSPSLRAVIARLDWLHRFDRPATEPTSAGTTHAACVATELQRPACRERSGLVERDGTTRRGADAQLTALSRLPVAFPVVAPLLAVVRIAGLRKRR